MPTKKHWATGEFTNVLRRWLKLKNVKQGFRNVKQGFELNVFHSQIKFNAEIKIAQILCEN